MKIIVFFVFIFNLQIFSQGIDYFPLNMDDTWEWYSYTKDSVYHTTITRLVNLSDSSTDVYFDYSTTPRYSLSKSGNVYQYLNGSKVLWYDFTVSPGDTFEVLIYSSPYYVIVDSIQDNVFGEIVPVRIFTWISESNPSNISFQWVANKFGIIWTRSFLGPVNNVVIGCIIGGRGYGTLLSIEDEIITNSFILKQNYPNPFNSTTTIEYFIPSSTNVVIKLFDALGREIKEIENKYYNPGSYKLYFSADDLVSGVYFYQIQTETNKEIKKLILLK